MTIRGMMPFDAKARLSFDLRSSNYQNACDALLLSSRGRVLRAADPVKVVVADGRILLEGDEGTEIVLRTNGKTLAEAYAYASRMWFPASGKLPDERFFTAPQLNTWVELNYNQNQESILEYARQMRAEGTPPGIIMIDDTWQKAYGEWDFDRERFPDPKGCVDALHGMGYKVMVWMCPWVGMDTPAYRRLQFGSNPKDVRGWPVVGGFLCDAVQTNNAMVSSWWNGRSALLDFTHPNGCAWFHEQLDRLQSDYGIDGFKFDGGEFSVYAVAHVAYDRTSSPADQSRAYGLFACNYKMSEYRNGWRLAGQPVVMRLLDKKHTWEDLGRLVPEMVATGLLGYPFVCPDMAGGGMWTSFLPGAEIDQELFVRSMQVHALCPRDAILARAL